MAYPNWCRIEASKHYCNYMSKGIFSVNIYGPQKRFLVALHFCMIKRLLVILGQSVAHMRKVLYRTYLRVTSS